MMHFTYTGMKTQVASNLQGNASLVMLDILLAEMNHSIFWTSQVLGRITLALRFNAYFCLVTTGWRLRNASASDRWTVEKKMDGRHSLPSLRQRFSLTADQRRTQAFVLTLKL